MKKNYKYLIVFMCMILQAIPFGVAQNIQPNFIPYLHEEYKFNFVAIGLMFTIGSLASAVLAPGLGKLFQRFNVKWIFLGGLLVSGLGILGFSFSTNIWQFYLFNAIVQVGTITFSGLGIPFLLAHWFSKEEKGKFLGIAFAGGSVGNFFLQPGVEKLLSTFTVHQVYLIFAIISLVIGIIIPLLFIRDPKKGEVDLGDSHTGEHIDNVGLGIKKTMKLPQFWLMAFSYSIVGITIAALSAQYANYFRSDLKMVASTIGIVGSVFAISCLVGNIFGGFLFSKLGIFKTMCIAAVLNSLSIVCMIFAPEITWLPFAWAVLYGLNVFSYMSAPSLIVQDLFGMRDSSQILGFVSLFFAGGFAIGNVLFGEIIDILSFNAAWIFILCCSVIGFVTLLIFIYKIQNKEYYKIVEKDNETNTVKVNA